MKRLFVLIASMVLAIAMAAPAAAKHGGEHIVNPSGNDGISACSDPAGHPGFDIEHGDAQGPVVAFGGGEWVGCMIGAED